jgi:hypothetical protein
VPAVRRPLRLYTQPSEHPLLDWAWVQVALETAGIYWVVARSDGFAHPRPVWGVWAGDALHLSIGSPVIRRALEADPRVTVHLESGTDVIIVEGHALATTSTAASVLQSYDRKYDWQYDEAQYGPIAQVAPQTVIAWRTSGWAGRDSFRETGSWAFGSPEANQSRDF